MTYPLVSLACLFLFLFGVVFVGISFLRCFKGVPLIRPFFIIVGLLMMSLSTLVVLFVFLLCFTSGVAVA
jgi:hypothetical protein